MADKDFLSQFSDDNKKPDSFKEEERTPISNDKKINPKGLIIGLLILLVIGVLVFLLFLRPTIEVVNFEGQNAAEATAWLKQQGIETGGVLFKEEYNFDIDEDVIISQTPNKGKIKKDAIMTFVVSKGADPYEELSLPDIKNMNKEDIEDWIKENKLLKTKINTTYDEEVEEGKVIKTEFSGCDEDNFTRGCSLKVSISKGARPKEQLTVEDFVGKTQAEAEAWAKEKKVEIKVTEAYSNTVEVGKIISQNPISKQKMNQGETFNITISKGKMVYMVDFSGKKEKEVTKWFSDNGLTNYELEYKYSTVEKDYVIYQSLEKGKGIDVKNNIVIGISLGNLVEPFVGASASYADLESYREKINAAGGSIEIVLEQNKVYSENYYKDEIVSIICTNKDGTKTYDLSNNVPMDATYHVTVSKGKITQLDFSTCLIGEETSGNMSFARLDTTKVVDYLKSLNIPFELDTTNPECYVELIHNDYSIKDSPKLDDKYIVNYYEGDTLRIIATNYFWK